MQFLTTQPEGARVKERTGLGFIMMYTSAFRICSETIVFLISECHGVSSLNTCLMLKLVRLKLRLLQLALGNIYIYISYIYIYISYISYIYIYHIYIYHIYIYDIYIYIIYIYT